MNLCDGQRSGALMLLIAALVIALETQFSSLRPGLSPDLPWAEQSAQTVAIGISLGGPHDGIYFVSQNEDFQTLFRYVGLLEPSLVFRPDMQLLAASGSFTVKKENGEIRLLKMSGTRRIALGLPLDPNIAASDELSMIPNIGKTLATNIVGYRSAKGPFHSLKDLRNVPGMSENRLKNLGEYLRVSEAEGISSH